VNRRLKEIKKKLEKTKEKPVGGIAFYISLFSLYIVSTTNILQLPGLLNADSTIRLRYFISGTLVGCWIAYALIKGHLSVFFHETKHALVSGLVGNKQKGLKVQKETGEFAYSYTKYTAQYNALISLAPYFLPLMLFFGIFISLIFLGEQRNLALILIGVTYGCDLIMNMRDISFVQTDIKNINGGYKVGIAYIIGMNAFISSTLLAYILDDLNGLKYLLFGFIEASKVYFYELHAYITSR
jgi:hypothetical protein